MAQMEIGKKFTYEQYEYFVLTDDHRSTYKYDLVIVNTETGSTVDNHCMQTVPTEEQARQIVELIIKARRLASA